MSIQNVSKHAGETLTYLFDFRRKLGTGDKLTGTPTVVVEVGETGGSHLAIDDASIAVTTGEVIEDGETIPIGEGVLVSISAGVKGQRYTVTCTADSDDTGDEVLQVKAVFVIT